MPAVISNVEVEVAQLREASLLPRCRGPHGFAVATVGGWRVQYTRPIPTDPRHHVSTSFRGPGRPDLRVVFAVLTGLGAPANVAGEPSPRFSSVTHYYWSE